ncbi:hypothetical protein [Bailinhaonella thermotolerans]|uniref:Uncharacterized protein n=1 Tax=Bailinhaonella thermotolerans TaxID=1070861 RepID=A0A3A4AZY8_9ACTN|nr:hypothetical protein [Bailinhaonella thermotolerans]RJL34149.1 hypothetical protein D5H75_06620 [Bailinhaonella thermotolerans]
MRALLTRSRLLVAGAALAIPLAGCGAAEKASACVEVTKVMNDMGTAMSSAGADVKELEKILKDTEAKLADIAKKTDDAELKKAIEELGKPPKSDSPEAITAWAGEFSQKGEKLAQACT